MTTLRQIAKLAGVSIATVSRVVNGNGYVKTATRQKILRTMTQVDYQYNKLASSLRQQEAPLIGIFQMDHSTFFSATFADALENHLHEHGIMTIMCNTHEFDSKVKEQLEFLLGMQVAGFVIRSSYHYNKHEEIYKHVIDSGKKLVLIEDHPVDPARFHINLNNQQGASLAMSHLLELGHRDIGIVVPHADSVMLTPYKQRIDQCHMDGKAASNPINIHIRIVTATDEFRCGKKCVQELLTELPSITAIFAMTDLLAAGTLHAAKELKLEVPRQLSVISYDDSDVAISMRPTLTSVSQPIDELGMATAQLLAEAIKNPTMTPRTITISNQLKVRSSTGPVPSQ